MLVTIAGTFIYLFNYLFSSLNRNKEFNIVESQIKKQVSNFEQQFFCIKTFVFPLFCVGPRFSHNSKAIRNTPYYTTISTRGYQTDLLTLKTPDSHSSTQLYTIISYKENDDGAYIVCCCATMKRYKQLFCVFSVITAFRTEQTCHQ